MNDEIEYRIKDIFISKEEIDNRVKEIADEIISFYSGKQIILIGILKGAFVFLADLMRYLELSVEIDFVEVSSYGSNTVSSGNINIVKNIKMEIKSKDVVLVEDIVDSGYTIAYLKEEFNKRGPNSMKVCSLLNKPSRRKAQINIDFCGFSVPDEFVVGYGMDVNEKFRNLPFICTVEKVKKKEIIKN